LGAERGKHLRLDGRRADAQGLAAAGEVERRVLKRAHLFERSRLTPIVLELALRHPCLVPVDPVAPEHHHSSRIAVGQGAQHDGIHDAENRGVRADAERERQDRDERERRLPDQGPRSVPHVA
jgi:hypothetical protein